MKDEGGEETSKDKVLLSGGKISLNSRSLQGFLLGLRNDSDFALEAKEDIIKVVAMITR